MKNRWKLGVSTVLLLTGVVTWNWPGGETANATPAVQSQTAGAGQMPPKSAVDQREFRPEFREGRQIEKLRGEIRVVQSRYIFFPEGDSFRFVLLENLNLERIARAMTGNTDKLTWEIDAQITEFNGANFLLIERAQLTAAGVE